MKAAHEIKFRVPFGDVDMMGHVNNARYLTYFETARTEHMLAAFGRRDPREMSVIIAHVEVDYKSPAKWNDELTVKIRPSALGTKSWTYEYEVTSENRLIAEGKSVQVAYDYKSGTAVALPVSIRALLLKQIGDTKD
ncbi:MAG: acyl-CoA thioesterase [Nitrososphaerales archaeon]